MYELMPVTQWWYNFTASCIGFRLFCTCMQDHILIWHSVMICSVFSSGVEIRDMLPTDKFFSVFLKTICFTRCSLLSHTHTHKNHHLLPSFTNTDIKPHINFSSISHLNHIFTFTHQSLSVSVYLPISYPCCTEPASPGVTVLVKYECAQWSVVVWSAALTMSFVSGLNRKLSSHSEVQAEVHTIGCNSENNTKLTLSSGIVWSKRSQSSM